MSIAKNPKLQYLKRRPNSPVGAWYLNVPIPKELQEAYRTTAGKPQTHIVRALGTKDPEEAYRRRVMLMPSILAEFKQRARELKGVLPADLVKAQDFRKALQEASNAEHYEVANTLAAVVTDEAERIHREGGETPESLHKARNFVRIAEGAQTLQEAFEEWVSVADFKGRTLPKYRTALQEFCTFLGGHPLIADMNRANALRYVDWLNREARSQRTKKMVPLSFNTKRDRVADLGTFWNWLESRHKTTEQKSPWGNLRLTEKPTPSDIKWDSLENTGRPKRREGFDDADMRAILDAPGPKQRASTRYTKRTLMEVLCLGLLTGARPDEFCSLTLRNIRPMEGGYWLTFEETKTGDDRRIPVVHPLAVSVIGRRIGDRTDPAALLFSEFRPKEGHDNMAELVLRGLRNHLERATSLTPGAVPYCTRHTFLTVMGNRDDVKDVVMKRYAGHKPEGMTDKHYRSISPASLLALAHKVQYPEGIEQRMAEELGVSLEAGAAPVA